MIASILTAVAIVVAGAAIRPRPTARRPTRPSSPRSSSSSTSLERVSRFPGLLGRRRSPAVTAAEVAVWCESLARVVRSGSTLTTAVRATAPPHSCDGPVGEIVLALDRGRRLADALDVSTSSPHLNVALTVLRACAVNGGPPAEPLDRAAATLRGRAADAAERQTQSAQARLSAVVMTVLPVAMLMLLLATSAATRAAVIRPAGLAAVAIGGALNAGGWTWMRRIIGRVTA